MRITYAILVHRNPQQVARLVGALGGPNIEFCLHVDRSVDQASFQRELTHYGNVHFVAKRMRAYLYSYRLIEAALSCFETALAHNADLIVLLSGQDYPLRPSADIRAFFESHPDRQFVDHSPVTPDFWQERIDHYYFNAIQPMFVQRLLNKGAKYFTRPSLDVPIYGGSAWLSVTAKFARHLLNVLGKSSNYSRFFRYAHVPEELAIQTVAMNGPFASTVVNDNLRYLRWRPNATHPDVFTTSDFDELAKSGKYFARKFDMDASPGLLDRLDRELLHRVNTDA